MGEKKGTPFYSGGNNPVAPHQPAPHRAVLPLRGGGTTAGTTVLQRSQRYCRAEETCRERTQMRYYRGGRAVLPLLERYYRHCNRD